MEPARLRVLHVFCHYLEKGGEEGAYYAFSRHFEGVADVANCTFQNREWLEPQRLSPWQQLRRFWHNPSALARLDAAVATHRPQVVVLHNPYPVGSAALFPRLQLHHRLPVVWVGHNFRPFSVNGYAWVDGRAGQPGRITTAGQRLNYLPEIFGGAWQGSRLKTAIFATILRLQHARGDFRRLAGWWAVSEFLRQQWLRCGVPGERTTTIRHAWPGGIMAAPTVAEPSAPVLFLGRLTQSKGILFLLEVWRSLGEAAPPLVIAGDGPLAAEVRALAAQLPRVTYVGQIGGAEKDRWLRACRAVIMPSLWWEALPLVPMEAYAYGKPMLAARSGGLAELVEDGVTGWLHQAGDASALAEHLRQLSQCPEQACAMAVAGQQWLQQHATVGRWQAEATAFLSATVRRDKALLSRD